MKISTIKFPELPRGMRFGELVYLSILHKHRLPMPIKGDTDLKKFEVWNNKRTNYLATTLLDISDDELKKLLNDYLIFRFENDKK